jgi:hypothetical protein
MSKSLWLMIMTLAGRCGGEVTGSDKPTASNLGHEGTHQVFCCLNNLQDTSERPIGAPLLGVRLPDARTPYA